MYGLLQVDNLEHENFKINIYPFFLTYNRYFGIFSTLETSQKFVCVNDFGINYLRKKLCQSSTQFPIIKFKINDGLRRWKLLWLKHKKTFQKDMSIAHFKITLKKIKQKIKKINIFFKILTFILMFRSIFSRMNLKKIFTSIQKISLTFLC